MSKKIERKPYTTKTAEEKKAFGRINPMVDTSKQSLEDSIAKQLNQAAIDKSYEQGGISNADFYQNAGNLGTYKSANAVDQAAERASLVTKILAAGQDAAAADKATRELNALKAEHGLIDTENRATTQRAGYAASEDITKTMSDAAVDRAKMGALYSTAASVLNTTTGPSSEYNKADNSITTDYSVAGVKIPGMSKTIDAPTLGGGSSGGMFSLPKGMSIDNIDFSPGALANPSTELVYTGSTEGKKLG